MTMRNSHLEGAKPSSVCHVEQWRVKMSSDIRSCTERNGRHKAFGANALKSVAMNVQHQSLPTAAANGGGGTPLEMLLNASPLRTHQ